jgi:hypothetical protein
MPNYTDVRAYFYGDQDRLLNLRMRCREESLRPDRLMIHWLDANKPLLWNALQFGEPLPANDPFALLPQRGAEAPFTLNAGITMPMTMNIEESSLVELAASVLKGHWRNASGPHFQALRQCTSQEEAIALMESAYPGTIDQGRARLDNIAKHGHPSWYKWCTSHWGTKWDASDTVWESPVLGGRLHEVRMQTAWSPPLPALAAMCKNYGIYCSCSYIDEGGGFSDYAMISMDGSIEESGQELGRKAHSSAKRAAREALSLLPAAQTIRPPKKEPSQWPQRMALGLPLADEHFEGQSAAPLSAVAARFALNAISPDISSLGLVSALDELALRSIVKPDTLLAYDLPLCHAIASTLWLPGLEWAWRHADDELKTQIATLAMAQAIIHNAPAPAAWAWEHLKPDMRPDLGLPLFAKIPETCVSIGQSDLSARHSLAKHIQAALTDMSRMSDERAHPLKSMLELWELQKDTPTQSSSARPRI